MNRGDALASRTLAAKRSSWLKGSKDIAIMSDSPLGVNRVRVTRQI
jgi:hypothetical protein